MPYYSAGARASFEPHRGKTLAGWHLDLKPCHTAGRRFGSQPTGASQRYGPAHCHPGQVRNAYQKSQ